MWLNELLDSYTTHVIAQRANTAVGSLYQFFPDKLAIFHALELRHIERVYVIWDKLLRPEIIQLPFSDFIHTITVQFQELFEQPTSRIIFIQFFTSPTIFKNINHSFTKEAINFMTKLFQARNPGLTDKRSQILAEISIYTVNTLVLLALRSDKLNSREIFIEIELLLKGYLQADIGDETINHPIQTLEKINKSYQLNSRQNLMLKYAINHLEITIKDCESMFPKISRRTLQRDLKSILELKLLIPQGNTDQRCYCLNQELIDL